MKPLSLKIAEESQVKLTFHGGYDVNIWDQLPEVKGIYVVFVCTEKVEYYECSRIAYIGKASNIKERMNQHVQKDLHDWSRSVKLGQGEKYVVSYAEFYDDRLESIEAALIYKLQPLANVNQKDRYTGTKWFLCIYCEGAIGILPPYVTASRLSDSFQR